MAAMSIDTLTIVELEQLATDVKNRLDALYAEEKERELDDLKKKLAKWGLGVKVLVKSKAGKAKTYKCYRSPVGEEWLATPKGKPPAWVLKDGKIDETLFTERKSK